MKKLSIIKNNEVVQFLQFNDDTKMNEFIQTLEDTGSWGAPNEYSVEIVDITAQTNQEQINSESLAYLASTDWYVVRQVETNVPVPSEILQLRAEARAAIVR